MGIPLSGRTEFCRGLRALVWTPKREQSVRREYARAPPPPGFFVSVADKGLRHSVSLLDATLMGWLVSVASKVLKGTVLVPIGPELVGAGM